MIVVDVFWVLRSRGRSLDMPIEGLRQQLDEHAPLPTIIFSPKGEQMFVFAIDFHRFPESVCLRLGFEYVHVGYMEIRDDMYSSLNEVTFQGDRWIGMFLMRWAHETGLSQSLQRS